MVEVRVRRGGPATASGDLVALPVVEGGLRGVLAGLGPKLGRVLSRRAQTMHFRGRADDVMVHHGDGTVVLLGLGPAPAGADVWRRAGARGRQEAERQRARRVVVSVGDDVAPDPIAAFVEGFQLAGYRFTGYASDAAERRPHVHRLTLVGKTLSPRGTLADRLAAVAALVPNVFRARDLVNEPASVATPRFLAGRVRALADEVRGLKAEAWEPARIQREGLAGLAAVARGSREAPRFLVLRWTPRGARRRIVLVGKGITFDSGGLSLKPAKSMETMKYDMAGGAAVIGAVAAAARLRLRIDVTAYVPATENLPGGSAQKPGDVIRFLNGRTVEVLNTDAEGRLVLADALALASRAKPDAIVDLATLTGACRVALGNLFAGVMGNDQHLVDELVAAGRAAGEPLWQLPLVREYRDDLKSSVADLKNVGGDAGTIIAGLFLQEFVDGVPWAHLDIAGPAFADKDVLLAARGGTGFGVRLLVRWLERAAQEAEAGRG
jgi:leucyl aminopeptidase